MGLYYGKIFHNLYFKSNVFFLKENSCVGATQHRKRENKCLNIDMFLVQRRPKLTTLEFM